MENIDSKKKTLLIIGIAILVIVLIGSAYAFFIYSKTTEAFTLSSSGIKAEFLSGTNSINIAYAYPISNTFAKNNLDKLGYIDFTVKGSVSNKQEAVTYEIYLTEDSSNTLDSSFIKVYLTDDNNQEVVEPSIYNDLKAPTLTSASDGKVILTKTATGTFETKYRLYVWIDQEYGQNEVNQTFSFKVNIYAYNDVAPVLASDTIKDTLGQPGGIIGVKADNTKTTNADDEVREYRYSGNDGIKNYIYFNCEAGATEEDASSKCELWRIVGIFKDESGSEHLKIVRDNVLTRDMFPETYTIKGTTYKIQSTNSGDYTYWNEKASGTNNNDWATAGLQYWLNTEEDETEGETNKGYLSYLKGDTLSMIEETKYYLGTVTYNYTDGSNYGIIDTPKEAYTYERAVEGCADGKGPTENSSQTAVEGNTACRVWANNQATWTGKVALLYPSDYGFSTESSNWDSKMYYGSFNKGPSDTSWLQKTANHDVYEWLLSPSSDYSNGVALWVYDGHVGDYGVVYSNRAVRPSLNLKSQAKIVDGDGTSEQPYMLEI